MLKNNKTNPTLVVGAASYTSSSNDSTMLKFCNIVTMLLTIGGGIIGVKALIFFFKNQKDEAK